MKEEITINKMETTETCPKTLTWKETDYSKMYFEFQFKDGEKARYRMDKDCHDLQQFLDRMNHFHDLEKENKRLQEQLEEANEVIQLETFANRFTLDITTDRFGKECQTFKPSDVYCRKYGLKYGWDYEPKQDCYVRWG